EERRPVVPLLAERITYPDEVRYALAGLQWVELLDPSTDDWLARLLHALARLGLGSGSRQPAVGSREGAMPAPTDTATAETIQPSIASSSPAAYSLLPTAPSSPTDSRTRR